MFFLLPVNQTLPLPDPLSPLAFVHLPQPTPSCSTPVTVSGRRTERKGWKNSPRRRRLGKKREPEKAWERIFGGELRAKQGERCLGTLQGMREAESEKKG